MCLLGFKISASGITSIPSINSLAYISTEQLAKDDWTRVDFKIKKKQTKSCRQPLKKEKIDNKIPSSLKAK